MINAIGSHRGYKLFFQETRDFKGVYAEPQIAHYLGQTFEQATATIDAILDAPAEIDMPFDVDAAGELSNGRW